MNTYTKKERNMYLIGLMGQNVIYNIIATGMYFYFQSVTHTGGVQRLQGRRLQHLPRPAFRTLTTVR